MDGAYDPVRQLLYFVERSNNVTSFLPSKVLEVRGTDILQSGLLPGVPYEIAYDPFNGDMYVSIWSENQTDGHSVAILNGTTVIENVTNATAIYAPLSLAVDPSDGYVYVASGKLPSIAVISGDHVIASVPLKNAAFGVTYDPLDGDIYAATGSDNLSVINGTKLIGVIGGSDPTWGVDFRYPRRICYDPLHEELVVTNNANFVTILPANETNGSGVLGKVILPAGEDTVSAGFDPANGLVYVTTNTPDEMIAINGTVEVSKSVTIGPYQQVGGLPGAMAYDPTTGAMFICNDDANAQNITPLSTLLGEAPPSIVPGPGADVGTNVTVVGHLWAVGDGRGHATVAVTPSRGLVCPASPNVTFDNLSADINATCVPTMPGTYTVWVNVTDGVPNSVWAWTTVVVSPAPGVTPPIASRGTLDLGQSVTFSSSAISGLAGYTYSWSGLPRGCGSTSASFTCTPNVTGSFEVRVTATDGNGVSVESSSVGVTVYPDPTATIAAPSSADVGQSLFAEARGLGGSGGYAFAWSGVPTGCPAAISSVLACPKLAGSGTWNLTVDLTDSDGFSARSAPSEFTVHGDPVVTTPTLTPSVVDVNGMVAVAATASGGSGNYTFAWTGLPTGCRAVGTGRTCQPAVPGSYLISYSATDSNGFRVASNATYLTVNPLPTVVVVGSGTNVSEGVSVVFVASGIGGTGPLTYSWSFGDGAKGSGGRVSHAYPSVGPYVVRVWANDTLNGTGTASWSLTVTPASTELPTHPANEPPTLFGVSYGLAAVLIGLGIADLALGVAVVWAWARVRPDGAKPEDLPKTIPEAGAPKDPKT